MRLWKTCLAAGLVSLACCSYGVAASTFVTGVIFPQVGDPDRLYGFDGETEVFATNGGAGAAFQGAVILGDAILVADYGSGSIRRFAFNGTPLADFASFTGALFLEADRAGNVYTTHGTLGPAQATRFNSAGVVTGTFTAPREGVFYGIDADAAGNVYARFGTPTGAAELQKYTADGTFVNAVPLPDGGYDLSIDEAGERLYLVNSEMAAPGISVFDINPVSPVSAGLVPAPADSDLYGLHYSPDLGTLFVTDFGVTSGDPRGMQLALDGTVLATYRPSNAEHAFDIVHRVPEPTALLVLVGGVLTLAAARRRTR